MNVHIPIYVEQGPDEEGRPRVYRVQPLFFPEPSRVSTRLSQALRDLKTDIYRKLIELRRDGEQEEIARWAFCPDLTTHVHRLTIELRRSRFVTRHLFVVFDALGTRVGFSPRLPELAFRLERGETLVKRATEVLTHHFRQKEKAGDGEDAGAQGKAWVTEFDLPIEPALAYRPPAKPSLAFLGGPEILSGYWEMQKVGRCLNEAYPDALSRAIHVDTALAELQQSLDDPGRRPVLLVGPRQVGKTALIHEHVFRREQEGQHTEGPRRASNIWLLSPNRLISGMSYVGQWENRLQAILEEAAKRGHVLYFDDLVGLHYAGQSHNSSLNVAQVLKPYIERREVRILGEITPDALRALRELDRGLADQFHVINVREPDEETTLRILVHVMRELEARHHCRFDFDALPVAMDLHRRYVRDAAFPGKAAVFLARLAVKYSGDEIGRRRALDEFQAKSGLSVSFLDDRVRLKRAEVVESLRKGVISQDAALDACADVISLGNRSAPSC